MKACGIQGADFYLTNFRIMLLSGLSSAIDEALRRIRTEANSTLAGHMVTQARKRRNAAPQSPDAEPSASQPNPNGSEATGEPQASSAVRAKRRGATRYGMFVAGPATKGVIDQIELFGRTGLPVVITGPSGTGKERVAKALHQLSGRSGKWVALNCGGHPPDLFASELFGYKKGAFTGANSDKQGLFQEAEGGTLFLDEIGEMPLADQVKLLRVLQERKVRRIGGSTEEPVDVRIVAATHRSLEDMVKDGTFREDLYYRLKGPKIQVLPLCKRPEEIGPLAEYYLSILSVQL
ncbi:MAG: sigma 54-interacting transcriptional regulator, partial [Blastocatellia bacterium]